MVKPYEKDMIVDLVPTSDGVYPYIPAQDWVESEEDWFENSKENPLTINVAQHKEFVSLLEFSESYGKDSSQALEQAATNLKQLIDNSIKKEGE